MHQHEYEYLIASNLTANWSCTDCLFPGPFSPNISNCYTHTSMAPNDLNDPEIRLVRGLKITQVVVVKLYLYTESIHIICSSIEPCLN